MPGAPGLGPRGPQRRRAPSGLRSAAWGPPGAGVGAGARASLRRRPRALLHAAWPGATRGEAKLRRELAASRSARAACGPTPPGPGAAPGEEGAVAGAPRGARGPGGARGSWGKLARRRPRYRLLAGAEGAKGRAENAAAGSPGL